MSPDGEKSPEGRNPPWEFQLDFLKVSWIPMLIARCPSVQDLLEGPLAGAFGAPRASEKERLGCPDGFPPVSRPSSPLPSGGGLRVAAGHSLTKIHLLSAPLNQRRSCEL